MNHASILIAQLLLAPLVSGRPAGGDEPGTPSTRAELLAGAQALEGLMTFHRAPDSLHGELPPELVGRDLGLSVILVDALADWTVRGSALGTWVVRWERTGDRLALVKQNVSFRAEPSAPLHAALETSFPDSPVFRAKRLVPSDDPEALLFDAQGLFGPELAEILPDEVPYRTEADDAVLVDLKVFPDNVVARVSYRYERTGEGADDAGNPFDRFRAPRRLPDARSVEVVVDYHLYRLPDDGYRPRKADERIGGMELSYKDYTDSDERDTSFRHVLRRWDVRKQDPTAEVSPPVEPITFYVDRAVPPKWRELVRRGALWWNTAFEAVGIRDAVQVLDVPDDPGFDPADIRRSMIYWNLSDDLIFSGLAGPTFVDPRTGEALRGNVYLNAEFPAYALHRYLVYTWWRAPSEAGELMTPRRLREALLADRGGSSGTCDRAASFSSQIAFARLVLQARGVLQPGTAEATRFAEEAFLELVAHEVGHALGFSHNWKASLISSPADLAANRVRGRASEGPLLSGSVMDYNPIYLAPRGEPQHDYFLRELGPYDFLAVEYVYRPFDDLTLEEEHAALDAIAARAEVEPGLAYDDGGLGTIDPTTSSDDLGNDPLGFAESRLRMIREEVLPRLPELVLAEGHDYSQIRQALDAAVFSVALDYVDMAARHVGGQVLLRRRADSVTRPAGGPPPVRPVDPAVQRRALDVLAEEVLAPGAFALDAEALARLKPDMQLDWNYPWRFGTDYDLGARIGGMQAAALDALLAPDRLTRILDNERRTAGRPFTLPELFERLREVAFPAQVVNRGPAQAADLRSLQRLLVDRLVALLLDPPSGAPAEAADQARVALTRIREGLERPPSNQDPYRAGHVLSLRARIDRALDARVSLAPGD